MSSGCFPRAVRLRRRAEFLRVQNGGEKRHLRYFLVFVRAREPDSVAAEDALTTIGSGRGGLRDGACNGGLLPTRLGITVTRKVGNAVDRNHIKRLVRDVFRQERERLPAGLDMVWIAKKQARRVSHAAVREDFSRLVEQAERGNLGRSRGAR